MKARLPWSTFISNIRYPKENVEKRQRVFKHYNLIYTLVQHYLTYFLSKFVQKAFRPEIILSSENERMQETKAKQKKFTSYCTAATLSSSSESDAFFISLSCHTALPALVGHKSVTNLHALTKVSK